MSNLIVFNYKGQVISRRDDGFINLTEMCQANGKRLDNWLRLKQTQDYISVLRQSLTSEVLESEVGGSNPGTWGHPSLAINLARWISPEFAVWCDGHIFNLMSGNVVIAQPQLPQTYLEALKALVASEERLMLAQAEVEVLEEANQALSEAVDELFNYSSIIRIAKFNGISEERFKWHRLKTVSAQLGLEIKKVPCARFGTKNLYSHDAWRVAYPYVNLPETTTLVVKAS